MTENRKIIGVILLVFIISIGFAKPVQEYVSIPKELVLIEGQQQSLQKALPVFKMSSNNELVSVDEEQFAVIAKEQGDANVTVTVGGAPVKNVDVRVLKDIKIIPGGQSIGVKLNTLGVLVVGHHLVDSEDGEKSPGELAEIEVGDIITKINGKKIENMTEVTPLVQEAGEKEETLKLEVIRENDVLQKRLKPIKAKGESSYRLGLYIRDSAAGVGTMTFYEPHSKNYGALGHVISDMDTQKPIVVNDGQIVSSLVTSIEKGSNGDPGEKLARFSNDRKVLGTITKNSPFGIFGKLHENIKNQISDEALPITLSHQVKEGPAKILTVVNGEEVKAYDIEVVSSVPQKFPATKGMVIKVTDPELLEATGGIIQGMSGSPIIQDGKVIGAVTHVFVNDPTSGYGCHIEWMLQEAGVDIYNVEKAKAS
jgi:stage IV sporulation protein B